MALWITVLAAKPGDLSSLPRRHMGERKATAFKLSFSSWRACHGTDTCVQTNKSIFLVTLIAPETRLLFLSCGLSSRWDYYNSSLPVTSLLACLERVKVTQQSCPYTSLISYVYKIRSAFVAYVEALT